jgi:hypothetical protein
MDRLPEDIVRIHGRSFSKQVSRSNKQISTLLGALNLDMETNIDTELLDYHNTKHMKHSELVENVERKLMNLMKMDRQKNDLFLQYYMKDKPSLETAIL